MNFDWTKPVVIDWSGRSGPLISEDDIKNSVIKRILRNQFCPPFCEREYISLKPWWNPQDPFGSQYMNNNNKKILFIPGLWPLPVYPQTSTLTKEQHLQGLKVMSTRFQYVQPRNYPQPTQQDLAAVEAFQELYEAEQKEYLKWAKLLWHNSHCLRALRPKPTIEQVYDAEFRMRMYEMLSMPQHYSLAAQIPLEKENGNCELELKEDLINVNVRDLPEVDYPKEMERDFSVLMKSCPVPEPCKEHPCKFVLPHEETVSVLPLSEIHRELANYAASNGATIVASENALRCLLETDRSWQIPVSVVEVICPENGDLKTIVVLGSEFSAQKECSIQRTYKAYKHLLRHTFSQSKGQYKSKSPTKQDISTEKITSSPPVIRETIAQRNSRFVSLNNDLEVSSDEDSNELLIADSERKNEPKKLKNILEPTKESDRLLMKESIRENIDQYNVRTDQNIDELSEIIEDPIDQCNTRNSQNIDEPSEPDRLMVENHSNTNSVPSFPDYYKPVENAAKPDESHKRIEPNHLITDNPSLINALPSYGLDFYDPDFNKDSTPSYSQNETFRLMDGKNCGLDFYQPDYSIDTRPNYSRDDDEPSSEPDKVMINTNKINPELINESSQVHSETIYRRNSHELNVEELNSEPDRLTVDSINDCNPESNCVLNFYDLEDDTRQSDHDEPDSEPDQLLINGDKRNSETKNTAQTNKTVSPMFKTKNVSMFDINNLDNTTQSDSHVEPHVEPHSEPDQRMINDDKSNSENNDESTHAVNNETVAPMFKTKNVSMFEINDLDNTRQSDSHIEPPCEPDQRMINDDKSNSETNDESTHAVNKETVAPMFKTKNVSMFEINDETAQTQISDILWKNTATLINTNKELHPCKQSDEQKTRHSSNDKVYNIVCQEDVPTKHIAPIKCEAKTNHFTLSSKQSTVKCEIQNVEAPKALSPVKPCRISVRNLSISELKSYNLAAYFNSSTTDVSEKHLVHNNDEVSIINESPEKLPEGPARLGISGIITRKQSSISAGKLAGANDPLIETKKEVPRRGISGMIHKNQSSPKKFDYFAMASDINNTKDVTRPEISQRITRNRSAVINAMINEPVIEKAKEVQSLEISRMLSRNRSFSRTDNLIEGIDPIIPKPKEISPRKNIPGINKNLTSHTKGSGAKKKLSLEPVRNNFTKIRKSSEVVDNVETTKATTENQKLQETQNVSNHNDEVKRRTSKTNLELSPVKPCRISVEKMDVEPYVRKRISETNVIGANVINGNEAANIVEALRSPVKTISRKRGISEAPDNIDPHNRYANLKTYRRISKNNKSVAKTCSRKSSLKAGMVKSKTLISNQSIETETTLNDSNQPSTKRVKKLSDQVNLEHGYCQIRNQIDPRKRSISEIKHDYCGSDRSFDEESDTVMLFIDCPNVDNTDIIFDIIEPTYHSPIFIDKNTSNVSDDTNITANRTSSNSKSKTEKIFSDLFGDDSDDEPMFVHNDKNTTINATDSINERLDENYDTRMLSFDDSIPKSAESPPKPCHSKSISYSPRNTKRTLSFSDPLTSDPDSNNSISEPDSEDAIAGFINGVAVPFKPKNMKQKQNSTVRSYSLRSKNKATPVKDAKLITNEISNKGSFTKITPAKKINTRSSQRTISCSNSDSNEPDAKSSKQNLLASKQSLDTNKGIIENTSLRKSRRLNTKSNDVVTKAQGKMNVNDSSEITEGLTISRRVSEHTKAKENMQPDTTKCLKNSTSKSLPKLTPKKDNRVSNRRKSLPSKMFSDTNKSNQIIRSKSLTDLNEITDTTHSSQSYSYTTRSKSLKRESLILSERTKRYLRRVFNIDDDDQSEGESQRTLGRSRLISSPSSAISDKENKKQTKPCTRSSSTPSNKDTKTNRSINKIKLSVKSRRYTLRSAAAYSSCDETEQLERARRTRNKKPSQVDTKRSLNTSAESNVEQFEVSDIKTEIMDTTEITDLTNFEINESTSADVETYQIKINVVEETDSETETLQVLHFIELPDTCEGNSTQTNEDQMNVDNLSIANNMECNETAEHDTNHFSNIANKMHVDADFDEIHSERETADVGKVMNKTVEINETELNENSMEIQQNKDKEMMNTKEAIQNNNEDDDSNSSDFFNMCINQEFNILHFTAKTENNEDSDDAETLTIDDGQSTSNKVTNNVKQPNGQEIDKQPKTRSTPSNLIETSEHQIQSPKKVELKTHNPSVSPTDKLSKDERIQHLSSKDLSSHKASANKSLPKGVNDIGVFKCTCKGTTFEVPPPRSFKKWKVSNKDTHEGFNVIVHSSHRVRSGASEVVLEPIVEYQPELGGSKQPAGRLKAIALSLMLRQNASLINVRIDHDNGNVIVVDPVSSEEFIRRHGDQRVPISTALHTALDQLSFLRAGQYVLAHDTSHGNNAMLYCKGRGETNLTLQVGNVNMPDAEDANWAKIPPVLDMVMLPYHKHRGILPLAFTPNKLGNREDKKMAAALAKARAPPHAIQWPKKKKSKKRPRRQAANQPQD